jgi:aconitate hydratase
MAKKKKNKKTTKKTSQAKKVGKKKATPKLAKKKAPKKAAKKSGAKAKKSTKKVATKKAVAKKATKKSVTKKSAVKKPPTQKVSLPKVKNASSAKIETTPELVERVYKKTQENLKVVRTRLGRPMTLAEKVMFGHLVDPKNQDLTRGKSFLELAPDRVAMQDATAQMAVLQFMLAGKDEAAVPSTVHCDHLIRAQDGLTEDMKVAMNENKEVFDFLASAASRYNLGFWKPGAGIIHQVILENYAFPGGMMIGTDSHTPNAGGLGMAAIGVGGADASDVMSGLSWEVKNPNLIGVHLKGKLQGWASPKDVIIKLCGILTVKGGTNKIVEYFGEGVKSISCTGKGTITNMGAELGATTSIFPYDEKMGAFLKATNRSQLAQLADKYKDLLVADPEVEKDPKKYFDEVIEIDLSTLEPQITGPHTPDAARPISEMKEAVKKNNWEPSLSAALIGSCTNSSYEDIGRATHVAKQVLDAGGKMPQQFLVSPGSSQIKKTIERDGQMKVLNDVGATVLANACGPCIGQWNRTDMKIGKVNTIINSFNRNFRGRNDSNPETLSFIGSPEITMALGLSGRIDFNPATDEIQLSNGKKLKLQPPKAPELPASGYVSDPQAYQAPLGKAAAVQVAKKSDRLQLLEPFKPWSGKDFNDMLVLFKAVGKCTTDHISPAGPWLKYRGHLDNISGNMLLGGNNEFTKEPGTAVNVLSGQTMQPHEVAREYKKKNQPWIIFGDENYGEGSSREHAAMSPRFLGCLVVMVKSFARIHETNLKKQGVLALTFANPADYSKVKSEDLVSVKGLKDFAPGKPLTVVLMHKDGSTDTIMANHSFNRDQIAWFKAGSALNKLRSDLMN